MRGVKWGEPTPSVLCAQTCLAASRPQPQPAGHNELRQGAAPLTDWEGRDLDGAPGQGCGGRAASAGSCTPSPGRAGEGRADERTNGVAGSRLHACAALAGFSSRPPSRLPRPGRSAPFRAFGPGSRSCDVISKASALSSDTQPSSAGPRAESLFTAAWAERGAEKRAQAPPGETAAAAARVATPAPTPTASPRAVATEPPTTGRRP